MFRNTWRVCSATSPSPTSFPSPSTGTIPERKSSPPDLDGVGVVADRLGEPFDTEFLTVMGHQGGSYNRRMEPQFVHFGGRPRRSSSPPA